MLSADYFSIPEEQIKSLESVLTIVGGRVVFAAAEFERLGPPPLPVSPDWSPVKTMADMLAWIGTRRMRNGSQASPSAS